MSKAIIGSSGFVGTTLSGQLSFDKFYRSTNIEESAAQHFDLVVCAAARAQKWVANQKPQEDEAHIQELISHLKKITCEKFILISTVDIFQTPIGVDEDSTPIETNLHPYGKNRLTLEKFVGRTFANSLVVRLPGLVGAGLRKNAIYDLAHNNNLDKIDRRGVFQFYPMKDLWSDLEIALGAGVPLIHLSAPPISIEKIAQEAFGIAFGNELAAPPARYDLRTKYANIFNASGFYQKTLAQTLAAIKDYAQQE